MRAPFWILLIGGALTVMMGIRMRGWGEQLVLEDGKSAATVLPLDRVASQVKFETATFGLG